MSNQVGYIKDSFSNILSTYKRKVLWTSTATSLNASTISIPDLNKYDWIEIFFYNFTETQKGISSTSCEVSNGAVINLFYTINNIGNNICHFGSRLGTINTNNNTITWTQILGCVVPTTGGTPSATTGRQDWGVPFKIVGWKYGN